jgi:hypothetical protein
MRTDPVRIISYGDDSQRERRKVSPFMSYEVAKGIVEEMRLTAERRRWWSRTEKEIAAPLRSWDIGVIELVAESCEDEQEMVGA